MAFSWGRTVIPVAALFSFRMFGLFMLMPVFTLYAMQLTAATPAAIGFALGAYGLSQGLLQMPLGILSDHLGRKPVLTLGLLLFALGSALGACTHSMTGMILARTLQGTGAIGAVLIALLADLTPESSRTTAMAIIGATIGISFALAMVISPAITAAFGLSGIFSLTTVLALLGLLLLHTVIPTPSIENRQKPTWAILVALVKNPVLARLNAGIFFQHLLLTATFFALPLRLQTYLQAGNLSSTWHFYGSLMLFSFILILPLIRYGEKYRHTSTLFRLAVIALLPAQMLLIITPLPWIAFCGLVLVYFIAFNLLEAMLPSLISRSAPASTKGSAMGIYSTCQFLGIFAGGLSAGLLDQWIGIHAIFIFNSVIALLWFMLLKNKDTGIPIKDES